MGTLLRGRYRRQGRAGKKNGTMKAKLVLHGSHSANTSPVLDGKDKVAATTEAKPAATANTAVGAQTSAPASNPWLEVMNSMTSPTWLEIVEEQDQERQRLRELREQEDAAEQSRE